jgi:hypothetical protein
LSKAHFAAQQLRGAARIWWDNFCAMQPAGHLSLGRNFGLPSGHIIFLKDKWSRS